MKTFLTALLLSLGLGALAGEYHGKFTGNVESTNIISDKITAPTNSGAGMFYVYDSTGTNLLFGVDTNGVTGINVAQNLGYTNTPLEATFKRVSGSGTLGWVWSVMDGIYGRTTATLSNGVLNAPSFSGSFSGNGIGITNLPALGGIVQSVNLLSYAGGRTPWQPTAFGTDVYVPPVPSWVAYWDIPLSNAMQYVSLSAGSAGFVYIPPGIYAFSNEIRVPKNVSLYGAGIMHDPAAGMLTKTNVYTVLWSTNGMRFRYTYDNSQYLQHLEICGATNPLMELTYSGTSPLSLNAMPESSMGNTVGLEVEGDLDGAGKGSWTGQFDLDYVCVSGFKIGIVSSGNSQHWKRCYTAGCRFGFMAPGCSSQGSDGVDRYGASSAYGIMTNYMFDNGFYWFVTNYMNLIKNQDGTLKTRFFPADQNTFILPMFGNYTNGVAWVIGSPRFCEPTIINDCSGSCPEWAWLLGNANFNVNGCNSELIYHQNDSAIKVFGTASDVTTISIRNGRFDCASNTPPNNTYSLGITNWALIRSFAPSITGVVRDCQPSGPNQYGGFLVYVKQYYDLFPFEVSGPSTIAAVRGLLGAYGQGVQNNIHVFPVGPSLNYHAPEFQWYNPFAISTHGNNTDTNAAMLYGLGGAYPAWMRGRIGLMEGNPDFFSSVIFADGVGLYNNQLEATQFTNSYFVRFLTSDPMTPAAVKAMNGLSTNYTVQDLTVLGTLTAKQPVLPGLNSASNAITVSASTNIYNVVGTNQLVTLPNCTNSTAWQIYRFSSTNGYGSFILTNANGVQTIRDGSSLYLKQVGIGEVGVYHDGHHWWLASKAKTILPDASWSLTTNLVSIADVITNIPFNQLEYNNSQGIAFVDPGKFYITNFGQYLFTFSAMIQAPSGGEDHSIWLRQSGVDMARSRTKIVAVGKGAVHCMTVNFILNVSTNNTFFELYSASHAGGTVLMSEAANPTSYTAPVAPAVIVTINKVSDGWP